MPARVYICDSKDVPSLKKLLEYDPYLDKSLSEEQLAKLKGDAEANVIFARQDYKLKDGISLELDRDKYYLYISATEEFLDNAEKKLKQNISSVARVDHETEDKIVNTIEEEQNNSEQGIGFIFS